MSRSGLARAGVSRRLLVLLLVLTGGWRLARACPELASSGCSCADERGKSHSQAQTARRRVSCAGRELSDTPDSSLLPNRTVSLVKSTLARELLHTAAVVRGDKLD